MADMEPTYFTCNLGEAAKWNETRPHTFRTVNHLIDEQAKECGQRLAVHFPGGSETINDKQMKADFTYSELRDESVAASQRLRQAMQTAADKEGSTVGLLCASTPEFIQTWLGLMRLGRSVMLLAYVLSNAQSDAGF